MKTRPNLVNFFYLVGSGLIVQFAGSIYRIWLARTIGSEGLGILQMIYPVYRLLSGLASIGLPMALTKWVAEYLAYNQYSKITALKNWALRLVVISSLVIAVLLFVATPFLSRSVFTDPRIQESLFIVALAIPFSALSSIYRGFFQGYSWMAPTAASEIAEQAVEITTTLLLVEVCISFLPFSKFAAPVFGLTMGEITCLATLIFFLKYRYRKSTGNLSNGNSFKTIQESIRAGYRPKKRPAQTHIMEPVCDPEPPYRQIFRYSWPILLNQIVVSISLASEGIIIPHLLISNGYTASISTGLFGKLTGMAEPVAYFPLLFAAPLGSVLSPQVSSAFKTKSFTKILRKISLFYLLTAFFCLAAFFIILFMAAPLARFLYHDTSPTRLIQILVIGLPFTGISILNISILAAVGATNKVMFLSIWGVGLKTFTLFVLTPLLGIVGAAWAINITQIFNCLASLVEVRRFLPQLGASALPRWPKPFRCPWRRLAQ
jgi:stage V sporulation protein B